MGKTLLSAEFGDASPDARAQDAGDSADDMANKGDGQVSSAQARTLPARPIVRRHTLMLAASWCCRLVLSSQRSCATPVPLAVRWSSARTRSPPSGMFRCGERERREREVGGSCPRSQCSLRTSQAANSSHGSSAFRAAHQLLTKIGVFTGDLETLQSSGVATTLCATVPPPSDGGTILDAHNRALMRRSGADALSALYTDTAVQTDDNCRLAEVRQLVPSNLKMQRGEPTGVPKLIKLTLVNAGIPCELKETKFKKQALLVSSIRIGSGGGSSV